MKKLKKQQLNILLLSIIFFTIPFLAGCVSPRYVEVSSTTFHGTNHNERGSISVQPIDSTQIGSLEFDSVRNYLLKKFEKSGYVNNNDSNSDFIAFVTYGIDTGKSISTTVPIYGQTGGGTSFTSGTVSSGGRVGTYSGTTTSMPTYGVIGGIPINSTEYKRAVNIDVYRKKSVENPQKVYELKAVSEGSCGNIYGVLNEIFDGMFLNFPGISGQSKKVTVPLDRDC